MTEEEMEFGLGLPRKAAPALAIVKEPALSPGVVIRRFSDAKLNEAIEAALATVPEGRTGAVVAIADVRGARLAAMARLGARWSVVGVLEREWHGRLTGEVAVRFVW